MISQPAKYQQGDLVEIVRVESWTLGATGPYDAPIMRECPVPELEVYSHPDAGNIYENIEGKVGLIVYVARNRLQQSVGYRVLIEGKEMFCKSIVADKYFKLVETQDNEARRSSKVQDQ